MRRPGLLVSLILAVGLAGSIVALGAREANTQFVVAQENLVPVGAPQLERLVVTTSDPRPGYRGRALKARCTTSTHSALGNPWSCVVRYPRLPEVRYRVTVYPDRSIRGSGQPEGASVQGALTVSGCCVAQAP